MFGLGPLEMLVILVVVLLFVGPDKLPGAAKSIGKGIRDLRKQTRDITSTLENDTEIGGAMRDLRSAFRGDPEPYRPPVPPVIDTHAVEDGSPGDALAETALAETLGEPAHADPFATPSASASPEQVIRSAPGSVARGTVDQPEEQAKQLDSKEAEPEKTTTSDPEHPKSD